MSKDSEDALVELFRERVGKVIYEFYEAATIGATQEDIDRLHARLTVNVMLLAAMMHIEDRGDRQAHEFLTLARAAHQVGALPDEEGSKLQ